MIPTVRDYALSRKSIQDFLYDYSLITPEEKESATGNTENAVYCQTIWEGAFRILSAAVSSTAREKFIVDLDALIADQKDMYEKSDSILNANTELREVYLRTEQGTSGYMHNQILKTGRALIEKSYQGQPANNS